MASVANFATSHDRGQSLGALDGVLRVCAKRIGGLLLVLALAGCYPTYNWREVPVADGLAVMAFPGKVESAERQIELAGIEVTFVLSGTEVQNTIFSVGHAQLPLDTSEAQRQAVQRSLVDSLVAGIGQEAPLAAYEGQAFTLEAQAPDMSMRMFAQVLIHYDVAIRVVAWGPSESLTNEIGQEFMRSLRLR